MKKNLYLLPFDHRESFLRIIQASSPPSEKDIAFAKDLKKIIYQAFLSSLKKIKKSRAALLVDPWLGREILLDAHKKNLTACLALEKSGQEEFRFEDKNYKKQLQKFKPAYAKVLVRYNPEGNNALNQKQAKKLSALSRYLQTKKIRFLFELLVPPFPSQLKKAGSKLVYDRKIRPLLMLQALKELQKSGVSPDLWKLEGIHSVDLLQPIARQVRLKNPQAAILILGRGENKKEVERWLKVAAKVEGVIGFAIGRTIFQKPLEDYQAGRINRQQAIHQISQNYLYFVQVFEKAKRGGK